MKYSKVSVLQIPLSDKVLTIGFYKSSFIVDYPKDKKYPGNSPVIMLSHTLKVFKLCDEKINDEEV